MSNWKATLVIAVPLIAAACSGAVYGQGAGVPATPGMTMPSTPAVVGAPATSPAPPSGAVLGAGATGTLQISALNLAFNTTQLATTAGQPFVIAFANNDTGIPHNIEIFDTTGTSVFKREVVTGPTTVDYQVPALAAGSYPFRCDIHPFMTGTLTVK